MLRSFRLLLLLFALAVPLPAATRAAERVDELPELTDFATARFEILQLLDGNPVAVGRGQIAGDNRVSYVYKLLADAQLPEQTYEIVRYDGTIYLRENADQRWRVVQPDQVPSASPSVDLGPDDDSEPVISRIGETTIAGVPTVQYQVWDQPRAFNSAFDDRLVLDLFVGTSVRYLHQVQVSLYLTPPGERQLVFESIVRFYDHDTSGIVVTPPPPELVEAARSATATPPPAASTQTGFLGRYTRSGSLPLW